MPCSSFPPPQTALLPAHAPTRPQGMRLQAQDGNAIVICNVTPGSERTNPWVINLRAHPVAQLQIGRDIGHYQAREATDAEVERLWPRLIELWPAYEAHYERSGQRAIFLLKPA